MYAPGVLTLMFAMAEQYFSWQPDLACRRIRYIHDSDIRLLREMVNTQNNRFVTFIIRKLYMFTPAHLWLEDENGSPIVGGCLMPLRVQALSN
jgi:hypothetical protein